MRCLLVLLLLAGLCGAQLLSQGEGCGKPNLPLHSAPLCQPPMCKEPLENGSFEAGTMLEYVCQPGYTFASLPGLVICHGGEWHMVQDIRCKAQGTSVTPPASSFSLASSIPLMAGTLVLLSSLILALTLCFLVARSARSPCGCTSQAYETLEDSDFVVEGMNALGANHVEDASVSLPSYDEAVYGHTGASAPPAIPGLIPLVLSVQPEVSGRSCVPGGSRGVEDPPPSYQEAMAEDPLVAESALGRQLAERWPMLPAFHQGK
ncbi:sushi domain-containing protein 6-like [Heteronotia binoei]|uniref:sushi domain-containing protein 6-like n=1 Tax=Heteronotia binoei TaxID=13085 RepID=UPI00292D01AA|nr:sushi domain-containing protein 6-like [Heteronotia binoei]